MLGILPYAGIDISLFELTKERLQDAHQGPVPPHLLLGAGMFSSSVGQMVAYPLGFVRTRLQACPGPSQRCCSVGPSAEADG